MTYIEFEDVNRDDAFISTCTRHMCLPRTRLHADDMPMSLVKTVQCYRLCSHKSAEEVTNFVVKRNLLYHRRQKIFSFRS